MRTCDRYNLNKIPKECATKITRLPSTRKVETSSIYDLIFSYLCLFVILHVLIIVIEQPGNHKLCVVSDEFVTRSKSLLRLTSSIYGFDSSFLFDGTVGGLWGHCGRGGMGHCYCKYIKLNHHAS